MTATPTAITRADILPMEAYGRIRAAKRKALVSRKRLRRVAVGPFATFHFENYDTMWQQIHEMLFIERGGEAQIADELRAYNPLVPQGNELVATVMFEIDDALRRKAVLGQLGGVEEMMSLRVDGMVVAGRPENDIDRTTAEGKASSVQFAHFPFSAAQIEAFRRKECEVIVAIGHPNYGHMAVLPEPVRAELAGDFA